MATSTQLLSTKSDWDAWQKSFELEARTVEIWDIILGTEERLSKPPAELDMRRYTKRRGPTTAAAHATRSTSVSGSATPQNEDNPVDGIPTHEMEMTIASRESYRYDKRRLELRKKEYKEQQQAIQKLVKLVRETVAPDVFALHYKSGDSLKDTYKKLEQALAMTVMEKMAMSRQAYQLAITPLKKEPRSFTDWVDTWEKAIDKAIIDKVAPNAMGWWSDLLQAVQVIPEVASTLRNYRLHVRNEIESNTLTPRVVASYLKEEYAIARALTKQPAVRIAKGSFGPTFNNSDTEALSSASPRKRAYTHGKHSGCRACSLYHELPVCWYCFPELAPDGWKPNDEVAKRVNDKLRDDKSLAREVKAKRRTKNDKKVSWAKGKQLATNTKEVSSLEQAEE